MTPARPTAHAPSIIDAMTIEQQTWVVMEGRAGVVPFLAWCRWTGGPKFEDLVLTATDGMSDAPEIDPAQIRLERFLFQVQDGPAWEPIAEIHYDHTPGPLRLADSTPDEQVTMLLTDIGMPSLVEKLIAADPDGLWQAVNTVQPAETPEPAEQVV